MILAAVVLLLGVGAFGVRYVRKRIIAHRALIAGLAAFEREDWAAACEQFRRYLARRPTDQTEDRHIEIPEKYARALLRVRPLTADNVAAAIGAYRRVLRLAPERRSTYEALAKLYIDLGDFNELAYIARKLREQYPDDPRAAIWLATARIAQHELGEARSELETVIAQWEQRPGGDEDYVLACVMLSGLAAQDGTAAARQEALTWLDRAVARDPESLTARLRRAQFYRKLADLLPEQRDEYLAGAQSDLEAATALSGADVHERLMLVREWMKHNELDRAAAALDAVAALGERELKDAFLSLEEWQITHFLLRADLLLREGKLAEGAALAERVLAALKHAQDRRRVLPIAARLYALNGQLEAARAALAELRELLATNTTSEAKELLALLEATIARVEGRPYRVIELLEPFVPRGPADADLLRVLAEAYRQTDQNRRAVRLLLSYFEQRDPRDDPQVAALLARELLRAGDWRTAARLAEALGPHSAEGVLLRLEARFRAATQATAQPDRQALEDLLAAAERLAAAAPGNVQIRLLQAAVAGLLGQVELAEQVLADAAATCTEPLPAELALARLYAQTQRLDEAHTVCRRACERDPEAVAAWATLAEIQERRADASVARQTLEEALAAAKTPDARRELALRLAGFDLLHGQRQKGIERLRALAAEYPSDVRSRSLLLDMPEVAGDAEQAGRLIAELRAIEGERGLLWRAHQAALWLAGADWQDRKDEARELLEYCLEADPGWPAAALLLADLYSRLGQQDQAEQICRRALAANPSATRVADRLLALLQQQRRFAEARQLLDQLHQRQRIPLTRRVGILVETGETERALRELELKVANDPRDADARIALAQLLYRQKGDAQRALRCLDEAEALAGPSLVITTARVAILRAEQRWDEARAVLDKAVEREGSFDAYFLRGVFLAQRGEDELAERDFARLADWPDRPDGHLLLGMFYAERERLDEAIAAWERGLESFPDDIALQRQLMTGLLARNQADDRERGQRLLSALEKRAPADPQLLWVRAVLALNEATPQATATAQKLLERIVELEPTAVEAHLKLIELAQRAGELSSARQRAVRALGANPDEPRLLVARARVERALGNAETARALLRLVLAGDPQNVEVLHLFVQLGLEAGTPAALGEAQEQLERALATGVDDPQLQIDALLVLEAQGQTARVDELLGRLQEAGEPRRAVPALLALSQLHWHRGDLTLGEQRLNQAAALAPDEPRVLERRVAWLGGLGRLDELATLVRGDCPDPPFMPEILFAAGTHLAGSDDQAHRRLASELFERVLAREPEESPLWFDAVGWLYQAGAVERAVELYRHVLARNPESLRALNDLAWILAEAFEDYEQALPLAERGLELAPDDVHLLDTRGVILTHLPGRLEDARRDFEKCVKLQPPGTPARARALLRLARVTARLGDRLTTRRCLREALAIDRRNAVFSAREQNEISRLGADVGVE